MPNPIEASLGALHLASGVSAFFLGCLVLQAYRYFSDYPRDSKWIKYLIALMLLAELALHVTLTQASYILNIIHAGDPLVLLRLKSSQLAPPLFLSQFAIPMNEMFYYWRLYRLMHLKWPCIIATVLSGCRTCGWLYFLSRVTQLGLAALILDTSLRWLVTLLFVFTFFLNSSIVLVMTLYLMRHRNSPIMMTRRLVQRLIMWTISTGMIAMYKIPQMLAFILFLTMRDSLMWMCIVPIYTKVFANCLLSTFVQTAYVDTTLTLIPRLNNRPVITDDDNQRMPPKAVEAGKEIESLSSPTLPQFATVSIAPAFATPSTLSGFEG